MTQEKMFIMDELFVEMEENIFYALCAILWHLQFLAEGGYKASFRPSRLD